MHCIAVGAAAAAAAAADADADADMLMLMLMPILTTLPLDTNHIPHLLPTNTNSMLHQLMYLVAHVVHVTPTCIDCSISVSSSLFFIYLLWHHVNIVPFLANHGTRPCQCNGSHFIAPILLCVLCKGDGGYGRNMVFCVEQFMHSNR